MTPNNYYNTLPKSWDELKASDYIELINAIPGIKPDDYDENDWNEHISLITLSILFNITIEEIRQLPASTITGSLQALKYLDKLPTPKKSKYKLRSLENVSYDTFTTYQKLRVNQWDNFLDIVALFVLDKTKEELKDISVQEVTDCFFTLNKSMVKSLARSLVFSGWQIMKNWIMKILKRKKKE